MIGPLRIAAGAGLQSKIVVMPLIPGSIRRGFRVRSDLSYAKYSRATWEWWCRRNGADFVVIDTAVSDPQYAQMPPTLQRWVAVQRLIEERGNGVQVAMVDADTMIRWNAPDIFGQARGLSAVIDSSPPDWIERSTRNFQHLFPGTSLPWWEYFNTGIVVLGAAQHRIVSAFLNYAVTNWPDLNAAIKEGRNGTDQTPFNFIVKREGEPVCCLPRPFNLLHCFPLEGELIDMELSPEPDAAVFIEKAFARPWTLNFVAHAYVWHFTNVVAMRSAVMRETWLRVRRYYPGAICDE